MLRKKAIQGLRWGTALLPPLLGCWILASIASWQPRQLAHLPAWPKDARSSRFEVSPSQDLVLTQTHVQPALQWRVFRLSTGETILNRTTALWEAFALRPDETGFVALELQPNVPSIKEETFYRPIFGDFASQAGSHRERRGAIVALKDPNVATNVAFSRDGHSLYGLFTRDGAEWNLDSGTLKRRISVGDPWSDRYYASADNRASLEFLPDATIYAQATNEHLSFWDFETTRKLFQVPPLPKELPLPATDSDYVWFCHHPFSFSSQILAVVRPYDTPLLVVYDLKTGHVLWRQMLSTGSPFCFLAPDGQNLVIVANNQLELRAARTGQLLRHFAAPHQIVAAQNCGDYFFYLDEKSDLFRQRLR